ncbi:hypothetical protein, partial [Pseudonocardia sp. NPDC049635]|uniref:hypothetical protein n=1 Tax=Pseudonocardia sp. NPDC049635 TaxID=3155506 RepID=UPI0033CAB849
GAGAGCGGGGRAGFLGGLVRAGRPLRRGPAPAPAAARAAAAGSAPAADGRDPAGARESREMAENALTRELAALGGAVPDPRLAAELDDAQQLVVLARRVHNDAVRDTRVLRSRRLVRGLRLHGTAPEPVYFEIVDPEPSGSRGRTDVGSTGHRTVM